ncbi:MAG: hypothetical protein AAGM22_01555 [Acidobacteriota bacterium]
MTREDRSDLRRRLREGREGLRRRLTKELGRVDFKALRTQVRAAQAAQASKDSADASPGSTPSGSAAPVSEQTRNRITTAQADAAEARARLQREAVERRGNGSAEPSGGRP